MHGSCLVCVVTLGAVFLLGSCEELSRDLVFSSPASHPMMSDTVDSAEQTDPSTLEPDNASIPGILTGSQESGFSSEELEDTKLLQPQFFWDDAGEINSTNLDADSPEASPAQTSSDFNSSIPRVLTESADPDVPEGTVPELWEMQGESSSSQSELPSTQSTDPSSTPGAPFTEAGSITEAFAPWQTETTPESATLLDTEQPSSGANTGPDVLLPLYTADTVLGMSPEIPPGDFSPLGRDILDTVSMVTAIHGREDETTIRSNLGGTLGVHTASSRSITVIPWPGVSTVPETPEQHLRQTTESGAGSEYEGTPPPQDMVQVICGDWSDLAGTYVILNMSENVDCDTFRVESGDRLLEMLESAFSRKMNSPQGSWLISLSKPDWQDKQLLMTLASEQGFIPTKDVLSMLGEIRRSLYEIGIQNYTSVSGCLSRPSQTRSDYGKLFVVLVIIGSVCVVIIVSGLIYICWQKRLPKMKNMSNGEELHFVENGCHDNPTLDVTSDSQSEMQEKKASMNGVGMEGGGNWQVLVNKSAKEEAENMEEDTHL
ncbi:podocalyxin-like protein 2 [Amia ocellicauda]|uniref:podocalyxin-like protein 2 n=1 Tax=Amia ocellicauda TaxID=2972642 RepID=UPI0034646BC4